METEDPGRQKFIFISSWHLPKKYIFHKYCNDWHLDLGDFMSMQTIIDHTSKATVNNARYKVSRIVKLVEIVEIKVDCHFYFYYALVGLYSANFFC